MSSRALTFGFLLWFLADKRPFCRYACPLGLLFSLFNRVSLLKLEVSPSCNQCDACVKVCPVDIKVYEDPNSGQCIRCLNCLACTKVKVAVPLLGLLRPESQSGPTDLLKSRDE